MEAEYVAILELYSEILFIKSFLNFAVQKVKVPFKVHCAIVGEIYLAYNAKLSQQTKVIDMKYHLVYITRGLIDNIFIKLEDNGVNIWIKNTRGKIFATHSSKFLQNTVQKNMGEVLEE